MVVFPKEEREGMTRRFSGGELLDDHRIIEPRVRDPDRVTLLDRRVAVVEEGTNEILRLGGVLRCHDEERTVLASDVVGTDGEEGENGSGGVVFHMCIIP